MLKVNFVRDNDTYNLPAILLVFLAIVSGIALLGHALGAKYLPVNPDYQVAETARSLWERGTLEREECKQIYHAQLEKSRTNPGVTYWQDIFALGRTGQLYPIRGVLLSFLGAPFYGLLGKPGFWILNQAVLLAVLGSFLLVCRELSDARSALLMCALLLIGTDILLYSFTFSYDLFAAGLILGGWVLTLRYPFVGPFLIALSVETRPTNVLYALLMPFAWFNFRAINRYQIIRILAGLTAGGAAVMLLNAYLWGSPFTTGFQRMLFFRDGKAFTAFIQQPQPHFGLDVLLSSWPEKLFGIGSGLVRYNPLVCLFPLALIVGLASTRRRLYAAAGFSIMLQLLTVYSYSTWGLFGNARRYLLTANVLMVMLSTILVRFISGRDHMGHDAVPTREETS